MMLCVLYFILYSRKKNWQVSVLTVFGIYLYVVLLWVLDKNQSCHEYMGMAKFQKFISCNILKNLNKEPFWSLSLKNFEFLFFMNFYWFRDFQKIFFINFLYESKLFIGKTDFYEKKPLPYKQITQLGIPPQ
jgi:hypothetical protein